MKKNIRKGFTLVELLVVIAVLAILSAVGIVGYTSFTNKAHLSNDQTMIAELNNFVMAANVDNHIKTVQDVANELDDDGIELSSLHTSSKKHYYAFDIQAKKFLLIEKEGFKPVDYEIKEGREFDIFVFAKTEEERLKIQNEGKFSSYLQKDYDGTDIVTTKGVDVGVNTNIKSITYDRGNEESVQDVVIRTSSFETLLVVNAPLDTVNHYGFTYLADVYNIYKDSFHANSTIGRLKVAKGHAVVENSGTVFCAMQTTATGIIDNNNGKIYTEKTQGGNQNKDVNQKSNGVFESEYEDCGYGHHNMQKLVVDEKHVYEVCTACGYTVMVAGTDENVPVYHTSNNPNKKASDPEVTIDETSGEVNINKGSATTPINAGDVNGSVDIEKINECEHEFTCINVDANNHNITCSKCGFSYTEKHFMVSVEDGEKCSKCGYKTDCNWIIDPSESYEATCDKDGKKVYHCSVHNHSKEEFIKANGHKLVVTQAKEPTCGTPGNNTYYTCSVCNKVFKGDEKTPTTVEDEILKATGHDFNSGDYKDNGDGTHSPKCRTCDEYGDATNHTISYTSNGDGTHNGSCICGKTVTNEKCDTNGEDNACSKCGYKKVSIESLNAKLSAITKKEWTMPYYIFCEAGISDSDVRSAYNEGYKVLKVTCIESGKPKTGFTYTYTYSFATTVSNKNYDFNIVSNYTELKTKDVYAEAEELGTQASHIGYKGYVSIDSYTNGNFYLLGNFDMEGHEYIAMNSCNNGQRAFDVGCNKNITFNIFGIDMAYLWGANWKEHLPVHYIRTNGGTIYIREGTGKNAYIVHYGNPSNVINNCGEENTSYTEKGPNEWDNI